MLFLTPLPPNLSTGCLQTQPEDWSDEETLLLLEGLELYKDRWGEVADHVGTKSQVQCILHFLQLPIEDDYLAQQEPQGQHAGLPHPTLDQASADQVLLPFADTGNPILSQVQCMPASEQRLDQHGTRCITTECDLLAPVLSCMC